METVERRDSEGSVENNTVVDTPATEVSSHGEDYLLLDRIFMMSGALMRPNLVRRHAENDLTRLSTLQQIRNVGVSVDQCLRDSIKKSFV